MLTIISQMRKKICILAEVFVSIIFVEYVAFSMPSDTLLEKIAFPFPFINSFLVRHGALWPFPLPQARIFCGLNLFTSSVCCPVSVSLCMYQY